MPKIPLVYTFGNHMHWVDMQWLWGYHVLPGSIRDMLHFCEETGAKGNVNFDGIGYEKLAAENPEALQELKEAVSRGQVEPVGGSYGQPYGLFHGGESNVRQRIYGARAVRRLLGVWPQTFWEEEFDFFPQLPQMLKGVGIDKASLFFQWTWHTPEVPKEEVPVVWWEGQDGTRLLTATRNRLNLHQWPEDMDILFNQLADEVPTAGATPLILQWLELMPSPDWMCRSELLLPKLKELLEDERFDIQMATLGGYLEGARHADGIPVRAYGMDDVWHGMSLGKNGELMRNYSRHAEFGLLSAETLAAIAGIFGRPYAQWDVYPTWELEEAWRELLSAQHHDNDECEGLCGHIGRFSYERCQSIVDRIGRKTMQTMIAHLDGIPQTGAFGGEEASYYTRGDTNESPESTDHELLFNPLGWPRKTSSLCKWGEAGPNDVTVPPFGLVVIKERTPDDYDPSHLEEGPKLGLTIKEQTGTIESLTSVDFPEGVFKPSGALETSFVRHGEVIRPETRQKGFSKKGDWANCRVSLREAGRVYATLSARLDRPDGGMNAGLQAKLNLNFRPRIFVDQPYGISEVHPHGKRPKKYPSGDWMTSPQWFEEVDRPFTSLTLVDLVDADNPNRGLLVVHHIAQQWFLGEDNEVRCLLNAYDPWDGDYFQHQSNTVFNLIPHGPITNSERWKLAQEVIRPVRRNSFQAQDKLGFTFTPLSVEASNVIPTAFYRETRDSGRHTENYAANSFEADYPYILRLVEFDGLETRTTLTVTGTVAKATKTDLLGGSEQELEIDHEEGQSRIALSVRPYEIVTIYMDIVEGRKQTRDLDAKRKIWATVHRVES